MSAGAGYYHLHRGWMDNPVLGGAREPYCRRAAWCWLIENAAWKPRPVNVAGRTITLNRGQLTFSLRFLAKAWGWSEPSVRRFIDRLKTDAMIDAASDAGQMIITICNYDKYQADTEGGDAASDAPRDAQATQHRRKLEEGKKGKKTLGDLFGEEEGKAAATDEEFERWWALVPRKVGKGAARLAFKGALKKAGSLEVLNDGIRRYAGSVQGKEARYIVHPHRWLRDERWSDETSTASSSQTSTAFDREWAAAQAAGPEAIEAFFNKHRRE